MFVFSVVCTFVGRCIPTYYIQINSEFDNRTVNINCLIKCKS